MWKPQDVSNKIDNLSTLIYSQYTSKDKCLEYFITDCQLLIVTFLYTTENN